MKTRGYIFGILALTLALTLVLCGCSDSSAEDTAATTTEAVTTTTVATTVPEYPAQGQVDATMLNVRPTPGVEGAPIGSLSQGETVTLLSREGDWYAISYQGGTGYISAQFVRRTTPTAATTASPNTSAGETTAATTAGDRAYPFVGYINATTLNVRPTPSAVGYPIGGLKWGDTVTVLSREGDWYAISFKGETGYINAQYVLNTMPTVTTTAAATTTVTTGGTTVATEAVSP